MKKLTICPYCPRKFKNNKALNAHITKKRCMKQQKRQEPISQQLTCSFDKSLTEKQVLELYQQHGEQIKIPISIIKQQKLKIAKTQLEFQNVDLGQMIGMGSQGSVYQAKIRQKSCCVKKMLTNSQFSFWHKHMQDPTFQKYINVPGLIVKNKQNYYLFFQKGDLTLKQFFRTNPSSKNMEYVFMQLLKALIFLKEKKICHRDLSSRNILIWRSPLRVKLIDFGSATQQDEIPTQKRRQIDMGDKYQAELFNIAQEFWIHSYRSLKLFTTPENRVKQGKRTVIAKCGKRLGNILIKILGSRHQKDLQTILKDNQPKKRNIIKQDKKQFHFG